VNDHYTNDLESAARWEDHNTIPEPPDFDYDPADDDLYTDRRDYR
jgi:hypothetical protein